VVTIRLFAAVVVGGMLAAILGGFTTGDFASEGALLLDLVWGRVTLIDIYLAFLVGWAWIAVRERSLATRLSWLAAVLVTGSLALGVYLLGAAWRARSVEELLLGSRARPTA
jgi:hypothetical protein